MRNVMEIGDVAGRRLRATEARIEGIRDSLHAAAHALTAGREALRDLAEAILRWADRDQVRRLEARMARLVGSGTGAVTLWRSVSSPRPSNRACGSPAHGSPTSFTGGVRTEPARPGSAWVRRRFH